MGRTLLPYSMQLELMEERFSRFRRALRRQDQELFDRLFRVARRQLQAGVMGANPNPFDSMAMTMMIDLQKQVDDLSARVHELEHARSERGQEEPEYDESGHEQIREDGNDGEFHGEERR